MQKRTKNALVTLGIGLALNIALGVAKLVVGIMSRSVSVSSDAANNLSDAAVSIVSMIAVALSARAADHDHPYGHGRYEYIATFILGAVIVAVGIEVLKSGIERAITPVAVDFDTAVWAVLGASVFVKAAMAVFYGVRGKATGSDTVKAAAIDSASDAAVTGVVLACALAERFTGAHIDGYVSIAVALVILAFAVRILHRVINRLLGARPDAELADRVAAVLNESELAISSHDLVINDYGAANKIAEADVVFPAELGFVAVHAECDALERKVYEKTGVRISIHADPFITDDKRLVELRSRLDAALSAYGATAHDVGIDDCKSTVELHISLPDDKAPIEDVKAIVEAESRAVLPYAVKIHIDY